MSKHRDKISEELRLGLISANIDHAVHLFEEFRDREPLLELLRSDDASVRDSDSAWKLLTQEFKGESRPRKKQSAKHSRNMKILCFIFYCKGYGIPVDGESNDEDYTTGCRLAADRYNLPESTIRTEIWQKRQESNLYKAYENLGKADKKRHSP